MDYKNLFEICFKHADNLFVLLSNSFVIIDINSRAEKILGWEKAKVYNKFIGDIFKMYATEPFMKIDIPEKKIITTTIIKTTKVIKGNSILNIHWEIIPANSNHEHNVILISGKTSNQNTNKKVDNSKLDNIVKYAPGLVYWKDKNSVYQGCNDEFARLAGLKSSQEVKGKTDFDLIWKDGAILYIAGDQQVLKTGKSNLNIEEVIATSDNKKITVISNKVPLLDSKNRVVGIMGITTDITKQKKMEEELRLAKIAAESADVLKTNFIQNMQHDIRTPASGVWSLLDSLVTSHTVPNEELLIVLRDSAKRLWEICNDIVDFKKIENGDTPVVCKALDIGNVVKSVVELNKAIAFQKKLELIYFVDERIPHSVNGDEHRVNRILINLMGNALKFTHTGSISLAARLLSEHVDSYIIQLEVKDTGIGIPDDKKSTIYEKFNRLNPANLGTYQGSGLGLRIVKKYMDDLDGKIEVTSEINKGTSFQLNIVFKKTTLQENSSTNIDGTYLSNKATAGNEKNLIVTKQLRPEVLVIEDDLLARIVATRLLDSISCNVTLAINLKTAVELLNKIKFDFVLSDLGLPDGTGMDIIHSIKTNKAALNFTTPFFGLTANDNEVARLEGEKKGFTRILTKPLNIEILQSLISVQNNEIKQTVCTDSSKSAPQKIIINFNAIKNVLNSNNMTVLPSYDEPNLSGSLENKNFPDSEEQLFAIDYLPLLDIKKGMHGCANNENMLIEMLQLMVNDVIPNNMVLIKKSYAQQDWQTITALVHKMRSGSLYVGAVRMQYACQYLELYYSADLKHSLKRLYKQLVQVISDTTALLSVPKSI